MKKSFKIGLAAAMIALSTIVTVFGAELPVNVVASGEKSVNLYFGEVEGKVWVSLHDLDGSVLHTKTLKRMTSYAYQYELDNFPDGNFVLEIESGSEVKKFNLVINKGKVAVENYVRK